MPKERDALGDLSAYLASLKPGKVVDQAQLEDLLARAWDSLVGGDESDMAGYKLVGRTKELTWTPPELTFEIERHGGVALGSTRAELQSWTVVPARATAHLSSIGFRQIYSRAAAYTVQQATVDAQRIREAVVGRVEGPHLKWKGPNLVLVVHSEVIPDSSASATLQARRKRLRTALRSVLREAGWIERAPWRFEQRPGAD